MRTIKTRQSARTIKTFDRTDNLAQKTKNGLTDDNRTAEQLQDANAESGWTMRVPESKRERKILGNTPSKVWSAWGGGEPAWQGTDFAALLISVVAKCLISRSRFPKSNCQRPKEKP